MVLELDDAVNALCVNNTTLQLMAGGVAIDSTIILASDQRTITLTPNDPLTISTVYTLLVDGLCDLSGNILTAYSTSFTSSSSAVADSTRPVVSITPANGTADVDVNTDIVFSFNEPVDPTTIDTISVAINGIAGYVAGSFVLNGNAVTFTPDNPLPGNSRVNISAYYVADYVGNFPPTGYNSYFNTVAQTETTAPVVELITPVDNALDISITSPVVLSFSEPLHPGTVNNTNFAFYANGQVIRPSVSRSGDNRTVTLSSTLPANSVVSVVVTNDVTDLSGNHLADYISLFSTGVANDTSRPSVTSMYPANGSYNVADTRSIVMYTSEAMDAATLNSALYVSQNGVLITGNLAVLGNGRVLEFTADQPWAADGLVQVFLQSSATDVAGNALNNYQALFRIAADLSTTAPTVVDYLGSHYYYSGIPTNTRMDVRFSEALNPASVDATTVLLYDNNTNQPLTTGWSVSLSNDNLVVSASPTELLSLNQYYYVRVNTGVQDLDGMALATNYTGYFYITADAVEDTQSPHVISMTPADGAADVGINALTHIRFSEPMNPISLESVLANNNRSVSYNSGNNQVTIHPHVPLAASSSITESVVDVVDRGGNSVIAYSATYTTDSGPDFVRPTVVSYDPYNNALDVPVNSVIGVRLSEVIDPVSISETAVYLYDTSNGNHVAGSLTPDSSGSTLHFVPDAALAVARQYYFYFSGLKDFSGNACSGCSYFYFTTSLIADTVAPQVDNISITDGQTDLPTNTRMLVRFNEPVSSLSLAGVQILDNVNNPVAVNRSISSDHYVVTLIPQQLLAANSSYSVSVSGVQDHSGNTVVSSSRSFSTGNGADLQTGSVQQYTPIANSQNVSANPVIQARLSEMVDPVTVDSNTLRLYDNNTGTYLSGTRQVSADRRMVTFVPDASLEVGHVYYFYAGYSSNRFYDYAGNRINGSYSYFTVGGGDDVTVPTIEEVSLLEGQTDLPTNIRPQIRFNERVNAFTLSAIQLLNAANEVIPINVSLNSDQITVSISLSASLVASSNYSLQISGVEDLSGNVMTAVNRNFSTGVGDDTQTGSVQQFSPINAVNVAANPVVRVRLSEAVDPVTVDSLSFRLYDSTTATDVDGSRVVDSDMLTFVPNAALELGHRYYIYAGYHRYLYDFAGNRINGTYSYFNVDAVADAVVPIVDEVSMVDGQVGLPVNLRAQVRFNEPVNAFTLSGVRILNDLNEMVAATNSLSSDQLTVSVNLAGLLTANSNYSYEISGVEDLSGNVVTSETRSFSTGDVEDTQTGTIQSFTPVSASTNIPVTVAPQVLLSEAIDPVSVDDVSFRLWDQTANQDVSGVRSISADGLTLTFTPDVDLTSGRRYYIYAGYNRYFYDLSGNRINGTYAYFNTQ